MFIWPCVLTAPAEIGATADEGKASGSGATLITGNGESDFTGIVADRALY
jgi:hypothetical protein